MPPVLAAAGKSLKSVVENKSRIFIPSILKPRFLCAASAILLMLSFPRTDFWLLAWISLIPLFFALEGKTKRQGFKAGYLFGVLFSGSMFAWLTNMTYTAGIPMVLALLAAVALIGYLALYFGMFGCAAAAVSKWPAALRILFIPSVWVALEFIRSRGFLGLGWVLLGQSQYLNLPVIQIADVTGVFGVSFLVAWVNYALYLFLRELLCAQRSGQRLFLWGVAAAAVLALCLGYGYRRNQHYAIKDFPSLRVAVIQPNIAQQRKWDPQEWPAIMTEHLLLTEKALREGPELIVWPETSFPGFLWSEPELLKRLLGFSQQVPVPMLVGAVTQQEGNYYNSALLMQAGQVVEQHDKLHLVPFGEYVPLRKEIRWLADLIPVDDFSPGVKPTVFSLKPDDKRPAFFSILICFEDTISPVARKLVKNGARLLINMTNDAWYLKSKAPFLHLQASVFQAVENRRGLVRSANTGVSCFIDQTGRIFRYVEGPQGQKIYTPGVSVADIILNSEMTFYTKFGDVFAYLCFGCILICVIIRKFFTYTYH